MSKMTDPAVLIFKLGVPVASGLKGERQYQRDQDNGHDPVRHLSPLEQSTHPPPILLRRSL